MSRKEGFLSAIGIVIVIMLFTIALRFEATEPAPAAAEEPDTVTGSFVWKRPEASATPTESIEIVMVDEIPVAKQRASFSETCTKAPIEAPTPEPTVTSTPKPTATPKPTKKPTPKPTPKPTAAAYKSGSAGTQKVERGGHAWKPYARYQAITAKSSMQYKLQQKAKTDSNGLRYVTVDGVKRYCVALGVAWAGGTANDIGRLFDVKMENGKILHCVLGDIKKVEHSQNGTGRFGSKGELLEFQVDQAKLPEKVRNSGDISKLGGAFAGEAVSITVFDQWVPGFGGSK